MSHLGLAIVPGGFYQRGDSPYNSHAICERDRQQRASSSARLERAGELSVGSPPPRGSLAFLEQHGRLVRSRIIAPDLERATRCGSHGFRCDMVQARPRDS